MAVTGKAPIGSLRGKPGEGDLIVWECGALHNDVDKHEKWHADVMALVRSILRRN